MDREHEQIRIPNLLTIPEAHKAGSTYRIINLNKIEYAYS